MASKKEQMKQQQGSGSPSPTKDAKASSGPVGVIKAPGDKKQKQESAAAIAAKAGKRAAPEEKPAGGGGGGGAPAKGGGRKSRGGGAKQQEKKKKKQKGTKKRGCLLRLFASCGIGMANIVLTHPKAIETCQILEFEQRHLQKIKQSYDRIDLDGSGSIDCTEFLEAMGEQRSPFTDKLFASIDVDGSGTIEFDEFVMVLSTYCMFTKDEILRFAFECFDVDGSGTIDEKEFIELCKTVNNASPTFPANFKNALQEFDVNEDGLIDYSEFLELDRRYPLVLFPAFRLQDRMQKISMSEKMWLHVVENFSRQKKIEEYKATHGGRLPPDPPLTMIGKLFCPCLYRTKAKVRIGAEAGKR